MVGVNNNLGGIAEISKRPLIEVKGQYNRNKTKITTKKTRNIDPSVRALSLEPFMIFRQFYKLLARNGYNY